MNPRIYHQDEINQFQRRNVEEVYNNPKLGTLLAAFMAKRHVIVDSGFVVVGGRSSIEKVCRQFHDFKFQSGQGGIDYCITRSKSGRSIAVGTAVGYLAAPARHLAAAYARAKSDTAAEIGHFASNFKQHLNFAAAELARAYGNVDNLVGLTEVSSTRFTCIAIYPSADSPERNLFGGQIATRLEALLSGR